LHKLRFPQEKQPHLRFLALGFYLGTALIIFGLIGYWSRWCLDGRNPWMWILRWILEVKKNGLGHSAFFWASELHQVESMA